MRDRRWPVPVLALAVAALTLTRSMPATGIDLHWFWDQRCHECHGHAGEFARSQLNVEQGKLVGRHHTQDLRLFLGQHQNGGAYAGEMYDMLLAQAETPPVYQEKCARCHGSAAQFARSSLVVIDGVVSGRESQRPLIDILQTHGKLTSEEVPVVMETLTRVLNEVGNN
jgi:hypothetical protein